MADGDDDLSKLLLNMIGEYQLHVLGFVQACRRQYGVRDLLAARQSGVVPERGTLDGRGEETPFLFRDASCRFAADDGPVEFAFGPGGRHDGFGCWGLWLYAESRPHDHLLFGNAAVVYRALDELVARGLAFEPRWSPTPALYYLRSRCGVGPDPTPERLPESDRL